MISSKFLKLEKLFLFFLIGLTITACNTEQEKTSLDTLEPTVIRSTSENPYEYVGEYHNASLHLINELSFENPELTEAEAFNSTLEYVSQLPEFEGQAINYDYEQYRADYYGDSETPLSYQEHLTRLQDEGTIGSEAADLAAQILQLLEGEELTKDELFSQVEQIEQATMNADLTETESLMVLSTASVVRNSVEYWSHYFDSFAGGTPHSEDNVEERMCGFGCWACVALWDGIGAIAGIPGGPVGIIAGSGLVSALARCCICSTCRRTTCPW